MLILLAVLPLARAPDVVRVTCDALATIPPTSLVGAILWTGHVGATIVTHVKVF